MRKLIMFNMTSVDGFFEGSDHDITWHTVDKEFNDFAVEQVNAIDIIMFGRKTYELMESYWPTREATESDPVVAPMMNAKPKIVVSTTLRQAEWNNTRLIGDGIALELTRMKQQPGKDLIIFGSGRLCSSLIKLKLIDEFRIMVSPIVLARGTPLFRDKMSLQLKDTRKFGNGNVLMTYSQAG